MPGKELGQELKELISSLQEQGILDDLFDQLKGLQDEQKPDFVAETIAEFLATAENDIEQLTTHMKNEHAVNFPAVAALAYRLKGSSSSMGGCKMARACGELLDASKAHDQEACLIVHDLLSREFLVLKQHLNQIAQMERAIAENEAKPRDNQVDP